jgi:hypothetical protein
LDNSLTKRHPAPPQKWQHQTCNNFLNPFIMVIFL